MLLFLNDDYNIRCLSLLVARGFLLSSSTVVVDGHGDLSPRTSPEDIITSIRFQSIQLL